MSSLFREARASLRSRAAVVRAFALALTVAAAFPAPGSERETLPALSSRAKASLAKTEGTLEVGGLGAPVEVIRDRWGIPHIYARTEDDLFFAQGYVQAQDRLLQMELWRRQSQGRLAELLGPEWVERDRLTRLVTRPRGDLHVEWASYGEGMRRVAERFVAGINAHVDGLGKVPPLEFALAGLVPEHWSAEDLLARAEAFGMSGNAHNEVARARLLHRFGPRTADLLRPPDPPVDWGPHPDLRVEAVDDALAAALAGIGAAPLFGVESKPVAADGDGSNNWVVAGARSRSGRPVLANDPHRALDHPSLRYLVHLEAPGLRAMGAVVPWFPGIAIGHNERIGWGLTIFAIDAQDLVQESLDPADPERYRVGTGYERMRIQRETIHVRGGSSVAVELKFTGQGPVVREDRARHLAWALRWTGSEPGTAGYLAGLSLARAKNWPQFREALKRWKMPGENFVYADVDGHIGYQAAGLAPIRSRGSGLLPVPASSGENIWTGFASQDELPHAFDPPEAFLATANHNTLRPGDRVVGHEWSSAYRSRRIFEVLREARGFGVAESKDLQQDVVSLPAREMVPMLRDVTFGVSGPEEPVVAAARDRLLAWDHRMDRDSAGAAIFAAFHARLAADYVASLLPPGAVVDAETVRAVAGGVLATGLLKADGARRDLLVAGAFRSAVLALAKRLEGPPSRWRWGALHQAHFTHRLAVDEASSLLLNRGPLARPGSAYTVNQTGGSDFSQTGGATFRQILDLADWDASLATSAPGQSGQPGSPHFSDLLASWAEGEYFPLAWSRAKVEEVAAQRLILVPRR